MLQEYNNTEFLLFQNIYNMFQIPEEVPFEGPMTFTPSSYLPLILSLLNFLKLMLLWLTQYLICTLIPGTLTLWNETYILNLC